MNSISYVLRRFGLVWIVYLIQILLVLALALQVYQVLDSSIGNSAELPKLLRGYDNTVFSDLLKVHGSSVTPLMGQLRWLLPLYFLVGIGLSAGLYNVIHNGPSIWKNFWSGVGTYYWPFFKISLVFLLLTLVLMACTLLPVLNIFGNRGEAFESDKNAVWVMAGLLAVFIFSFLIIYIWHQLSCVSYVYKEEGVLRSIRNGFKVYRKSFWKIFGLVISIIILQSICILAYWGMDYFTGMVSIGLIITFFMLQQIFTLARLVLRIALYKGLHTIGGDHFL